jgi:lipid-binding SYLF domain-containing protein
MKSTIWSGIVLAAGMLTFNPAALADETNSIYQAQLDNRIRLLTEDFETMEQKIDKRVPADVLSRAQGIILLDCTKAGFIFAYQGGNGVAMVRDASGNWSPAAFLSANEASLGFQIGGKENVYVILLMSTNAPYQLTEPTIDFGGEASGTAGNQSSGVEGKVTSQEPSVLVYVDSTGLYGGAAIKGGSITSDDKADEAYYGKYVSMGDILIDKKVARTQAETDLANQISIFSKN